MKQAEDEKVIVGSGAFRFAAVGQWPVVPPGWDFQQVVDVAVDSRGRVFVLSRSENQLVVFDHEGNLLDKWDRVRLKRPHGLTIGPDDAVYCTDDFGHAVYKYSPDGALLVTLGTPKQPSDTGVPDGPGNYMMIKHSAGPFNQPTNVALSPAGEIYVSDGYRNARMHKFSTDGGLLVSWGDPGTGPAQFAVPHDVAVASDGTVFVCDRENSRIQLFSPDGDILDQWTDVVRPCNAIFDTDENVYVTELGTRVGLFPNSKITPGPPGGRVSIFNRQGRLLARWGGGETPMAPDDFFAPHGIAVDGRGDLYVGEVRPGCFENSAQPPGCDTVPEGCPVLQKFVRLCDPSG